MKEVAASTLQKSRSPYFTSCLASNFQVCCFIIKCTCFITFPLSHIIFLGLLTASVIQIKLCDQIVSAFISIQVIQKCCTLFQMQLWGCKLLMQSNIQEVASSSGGV